MRQGQKQRILKDKDDDTRSDFVGMKEMSLENNY
jgi:hypothetical protein